VPFDSVPLRNSSMPHASNCTLNVSTRQFFIVYLITATYLEKGNKPRADSVIPAFDNKLIPADRSWRFAFGKHKRSTEKGRDTRCRGTLSEMIRVKINASARQMKPGRAQRTSGGRIFADDPSGNTIRAVKTSCATIVRILFYNLSQVERFLCIQAARIMVFRMGRSGRAVT